MPEPVLPASPQRGATASSTPGRARPRVWSRAWTFCSGAGGPGSVVCSVSIMLAVIVLAGLTVWQSLGQVTTLRERAASVEHAQKVLHSTLQVRSLLSDAETGQRGFLLTGEPTYLEPYRSASSSISEELDRLVGLTADDPLQGPRIAAVRALVADKFREMENTITAQRESGPESAAMIVRSGEGKATMDAIRRSLAEISLAEQEALAAQAARIAPAERSLRSLLVLRAIALIGLLAAAWALNLTVIRRRAELARSRQLLATTLASIGDGVIVTDPAGRVTFLNAEAERLTGWPSGEAAGRPLHDIFRIVNEETRRTVENPVDKVLRLGTVVGLANHTILIARDGSETPIDDSAAPIRDGDRDTLRGVVLVFRDFTQHKQYEQAMKLHQRELEARVDERSRELETAHHRLRLADRMAAVGTLASGLAHDIKNVLLPLSARLESVQADPVLSPEARADLAGVAGLIEHLREMARNLSLFARDPQQEGTEGSTELGSWSARVRGFIDVSVVQPAGHPNGPIAIEWRIPADLPPVRVAPHRLTQAVLNLVHNARDAILSARQPGVQPRPDDDEAGRILVTAEASADGAAVAIRVCDDGCGMDEPTRRRATELFFTTKDRGNKAGLAGSGLGLSLASAIAERAGGRIEIESEPGDGTIVSLILPVTAARPAAEAEGPSGIARVDVEDKRRRAMIVEILRTLRYEIESGPVADVRVTPDMLWIVDPGVADPARAAEYLRVKPGRRVVVLGGSPEWARVGAMVVEAGAPVSKIRQAIAKPA